MTEPPVTPQASSDEHANSDALWRWLVGGLAAGGVILGLLIAAYAVGYHHGRHQTHGAAASPPATTRATTAAPTATTNAAATAPAPSASVPVTEALVAQGKSLFQSDGCASCHSLTGSAGVGPGLKGLAGSMVTLTTGAAVTADDAYLERSIADPDAQIVKGFRAGLMPGAIASFDLAGRPADIRSLVAFIKSQK
jgi:cytochrome c2